MITPLSGIVHFKTNYNYRLSNHCFIDELLLVTYALVSNASEKIVLCNAFAGVLDENRLKLVYFTRYAYYNFDIFFLVTCIVSRERITKAHVLSVYSKIRYSYDMGHIEFAYLLQNITFVLFSFWTKIHEYDNPVNIYNQATIGPPARRHFNGVSLW